MFSAAGFDTAKTRLLHTWQTPTLWQMCCVQLGRAKVALAGLGAATFQEKWPGGSHFPPPTAPSAPAILGNKLASLRAFRMVDSLGFQAVSQGPGE